MPRHACVKVAMLYCTSWGFKAKENNQKVRGVRKASSRLAVDFSPVPYLVNKSDTDNILIPAY